MTTKEKSKWNKRTQCSAINCKNYQCNSTHLAFHRFPKDPDRCARWVQNLRNASLMGISFQRLHHNYRVCSAHFHTSQFKRPSNVHAGLKWDAVPTMVNAPTPPPPLDLVLKRKPPKTRQELPPKRRKKSNIVYLPNTGSSTADSVQQPTGSETNITSPDASVARPSISLTPLLPPMSLPTGLEAAAREHALKMKIRSLKVQVCKLKAEVNRLKKSRKACVNKESVMKQLKKLLPAKAYAFNSDAVLESDVRVFYQIISWTC
ncbi:52 kDa repressor of the inhibitor of the protein kinase-like isoform X2 [Sinocyclocheilus grahami]|uniref:52 kDa repressor of the inhibitor of the protein kinase-like isoform X2 n=1 Tax=Sinocyclocheilus grahami TaxID=75366 RepID=UPI0007ACF7DC|nr:PREDICTED: 52 kDa repressor of the inhibitor of the protein kinase-like isoform X2 [Sinocyclocheilus grahami]